MNGERRFEVPIGLTREEERAIVLALEVAGGATDPAVLGQAGEQLTERPLADAHARASEVEERIRHAQPSIAEVVVHTEP